MAKEEKIQGSITVVGIGSGNVATHLFRGLARAGVNVLQIYSRNLDNAQQLAYSTRSEAIDQISQVSKDADVYLVSVPDDIVIPLITTLSEHIGNDKVIAHTTGSVSLEDISDYTNHAGVYYPLQTFTKSRQMDLHEVPFLIEASNPGTQLILKTLAGKLSGTVQDCDSTQRKHLHVAAVASCNFVNHLLSSAYDYLSDQNIDPHLLDPLMKETLVKFTQKYPTDTQTGPAKRGDDLTIKQHLDMLADYPEMKAMYELFTQQLIKKYK